MIPYNRGHWRRSLDDRYETLPNERGGRALLGAPGETFRRETFRSAQASLASALGGGSAAPGEAPNLAPSARTVRYWGGFLYKKVSISIQACIQDITMKRRHARDGAARSRN